MACWGPRACVGLRAPAVALDRPLAGHPDNQSAAAQWVLAHPTDHSHRRSAGPGCRSVAVAPRQQPAAPAGWTPDRSAGPGYRPAARALPRALRALLRALPRALPAGLADS